MPLDGGDVTALLRDIRTGNSSAMEQLVPLVYSELRRLADACLRAERRDHTLQPTALVHEAYLRLSGGSLPDFNDRAHFFAVAARVMRQILVDHSRRFRAAKRGAGAKCSLDDVFEAPMRDDGRIIDLNDAMTALEQIDPLKVRLIEMKFFAGLTADESAGVLSMPVHTVRRQLRLAQAFLERELSRTRTDEADAAEA